MDTKQKSFEEKLKGNLAYWNKQSSALFEGPKADMALLHGKQAATLGVMRGVFQNSDLELYLIISTKKYLDKHGGDPIKVYFDHFREFLANIVDELETFANKE